MTATPIGMNTCLLIVAFLMLLGDAFLVALGLQEALGRHLGLLPGQLAMLVAMMEAQRPTRTTGGHDVFYICK